MTPLHQRNETRLHLNAAIAVLTPGQSEPDDLRALRRVAWMLEQEARLLRSVLPVLERDAAQQGRLDAAAAGCSSR